MKKVFKYILIFSIISFTFLTMFNLNKKSIEASDEKVAVIDDTGSYVYYRGSNEKIMRDSVYDYPTQALKATWVSLFIGSLPRYTTESAWKSNYSAMLDRLEEYGLNCVIFHLRTHNNALYKSKLNPVASWFSAVDFDEFDPITWAIEETHKRGIEFHAWLNPYRVNTSFCAGEFPSVNPASNSANLLNGSTTILDPGIPAVQSFLVDTCMEIVENYDVDAIHFDDYFYVSGIDDSATRAKYNTGNLSTANFRRQSVDKFIEALSKSIRSYNTKTGKAVQLGIAPSGIYRNGSYTASPTYNADGSLKSPLYSDTAGFAHYDDYLYADTLKWINEEWIDYMMPQAYWSIEHTNASYANLTRWWSWAVTNRKVNLYMGMGIYMPDGSGSSSTYWQKNTNEIRDQILNAQMYDEIGGYCLYSYNYMTNNNKFIKTGMDLLKNDYNKVKIPADVKKYYKDKLATPSVTNLKMEGETLTFDKVDNIRGYLVYKVANNEMLDQNDINQIYYYGTDNHIELKDFDKYTYYISTVNLANVISNPINTAAIAASYEYVIELINNLDEVVTLDSGPQLNKVKDFYNQLSTEDKAKVTNYNTYLTKLELYEAKVAAYSKSQSYVNILDYSYKTRTLIRNLMTSIKPDLNAAKTLKEVENIINTFTDTIDSYDVADVELEPARTAASKELNDYYESLDKSYYYNDDLIILKDLLEEGIANIYQGLSDDEITKALNKAKEAMDKVSSFKEEYLTKLNNLLEAIDGFKAYYLENDKNVKLVEELFNELVEAIKDKYKAYNKQNLIRDYDNLLRTSEDDVDELRNDVVVVAKAIKQAKLVISGYSERKPGAKELIEEYLLKLDKAKSKEEVSNLQAEFEAKHAALPEPSHDEPVVDNGCMSGSLIIYFLTTLSLLVFILKKNNIK